MAERAKVTERPVAYQAVWASSVVQGRDSFGPEFAGPEPETWLQLIGSAYALFDEAAGKFGHAPSSLGDGTVLMLRFQHRLSKTIDLFGYDAQWLSVFSPRIVWPVTRQTDSIAGRLIEVDPIAEILAKKLFYRSATSKVRDVYDLSAAIDLAPRDTAAAVCAASAKRSTVVRRLDQLREITTHDLGSEIVAYDGALQHGQDVVEKVRSFLLAQITEPEASSQNLSPNRSKRREPDR